MAQSEVPTQRVVPEEQVYRQIFDAEVSRALFILVIFGLPDLLSNNLAKKLSHFNLFFFSRLYFLIQSSNYQLYLSNIIIESL